MAVEPQKFPEVHHPPRGVDVKLFQYNHAWVCVDCNCESYTPSELDVKERTCPECGAPMLKIRDNRDESSKP